MQVSLREPVTALDYALYFDLRWRILRAPWTTDRESGKDQHEEHAVHLMAYIERQLVGVGRLNLNTRDEGQIRYMAVEAYFAGKGVGSTILQWLEETAKERGAKTIVLNARENAVPFYQKRGYILAGPADKLFGSIAHLRMSKRL
jgi:N-acetylglutamate synthase-like GNAT family acetyltransferase